MRYIFCDKYSKAFLECQISKDENNISLFAIKTNAFDMTACQLLYTFFTHLFLDNICTIQV